MRCLQMQIFPYLHAKLIASEPWQSNAGSVSVVDSIGRRIRSTVVALARPIGLLAALGGNLAIIPIQRYKAASTS